MCQLHRSRNEKGETNILGVGFWGLLGLIFITLKLTKVIDWSWLWVLSPFWAPFGVFIVLLLLTLICGVKVSFFGSKK